MEFTPEELKRHRLSFLRRTNPYPFMAIEHYNKTRQEEEQYEVTALVEYEIIFYQKVGFVHLLHIEAQPKYIKNLPSSSTDVSTKYFLAQIHQKPYGDTHVSDCWLYSDSPGEGTPPVSCRICNLDSEDAFKAKSEKLREEAKAQGLSERDEPDMYPINIKSYPCNCGSGDFDD